MQVDRFQKASELLCSALEIDSEQQRASFLKQACSGDKPLLLEVESLLAAHFKAGQFIQTPPVHNAFDLLSDQEERLSSGEQIGAYKIVREIGRGGMGAVYLAERADEQYQKYVAIKLLKRGMDTDDLLRHFRRERQILATFDHPNIARLHDGGSTETGLPYFVMEYVDGKPIDDYCDEHELNITQRLELFQQVCAAVSYAHRNLVVHRDIKPTNILVTSEGVPKLLDFGIATIVQTEEPGMTATGVRLMTPEFASPEQAQGLPVTTASDVYSLGVVLYELLTGRSPYHFTNRTPIEVARVITSADLSLPSAMIHTAEAKPRTTISFRKIPEGNLDRLRRRLQGDMDNIILMALRKEPERRYQSVEQFSEDIRRHLEGLPVIARKDTFSYRASKFVQRNKVTVAAAVFAILALLISATVAGIIQWRANQQARMLQEFGAEAARIEGIMRFAYLMPLHDISPEREIVMKRMRAINARMAELGTNAQGPGHYAIGRAFMALQQYEDARKHFERALNENGYRTPEVAYSYGLTLAMLYQTELQAAARISSKELRETRMKEIQRDYKDPAVSFIREGRGSSEYSEYAEAVVEFLDERYEKSTQKSEKAMQQTPWLYESKRLEAESYRKMGQKFYKEGNHSEALTSFTKAQEAFKNSILKGASDPQGYIGHCDVQTNILAVQQETGDPKGEATYLTGKEACLNAAHIAPKSAEVYIAFASLQNRWANYVFPRRNTVPALTEGIRAAQQATKLQPGDAKTHKTLGRLYQTLTDYYFNIREDPTKEVELGDRSLQRALEINPNDADTYSLRSQIFDSLAQYRTETGADPRDALNKSHQLMEKAISLNPESSSLYISMGQTLTTKGEYENRFGLDATESMNSALSALQKAIELNPNSQSAYASLAWAAITKADYLAWAGGNPMDSLDQAEKACREVLRIRPNYDWAYRSLGIALWRKAEFTIDSQKDPTSFLNDARPALARGIGNNSADWAAYVIQGELEIVSGRWKGLQQKSPELDFQHSQDLFAQAIKACREQPFFDLWYSQARLFRRWAEWKLETKRSADLEIRIGLEMVARALKINPHSAEMIATRGIFLLFQARSASNLYQHQATAEKAQTTLQEALKLNANLTHAFTRYLKEAEGLANSPDHNAR